MFRQTGLTLIELMVTLAIAIVLLTVAILLFQGTTQSSRSVSQSDALVGALNLARSEAVKRGVPVSVCPKANASETDPALMACGTAAQWINGWIVFTDAQGPTAGDFEPASGETVLRAWAGATAGFVIATTAVSIQYRSTGELQNASAVVFDVYDTGCTGNRARQVSVSTVGRIATTTLACP